LEFRNDRVLIRTWSCGSNAREVFEHSRSTKRTKGRGSKKRTSCLFSQNGWQKEKLWQLSVTPAIAGNEEFENLMHSFQLSQKDAKDSNAGTLHGQQRSSNG